MCEYGGAFISNGGAEIWNKNFVAGMADHISTAPATLCEMLNKYDFLDLYQISVALDVTYCTYSCSFFF